MKKIFLLLCFLLISCTRQQAVAPIQQQDIAIEPEVKIEVNEPEAIQDKIAVMLPFSEQITPKLIDSVEMALFEAENDNIKLILFDSGIDEKSANIAMKKINEQNIKTIIGPVYGKQASAIKSILAQNQIYALAITNNKNAANSNIFVMGYNPEEQGRKIGDFLSSEGIRYAVSLAPNDAYGITISESFRQTIKNAKSVYLETFYYQPTSDDLIISSINRMAAKISEQAPAERVAIFIPEGGERLIKIASMIEREFASANIVTTTIQFAGSGQWGEEIKGNNLLQHAYFTSPHSKSSEKFQAKYKENYAISPSNLAYIIYDATILAVKYSQKGILDHANLKDPAGFSGASGILRFSSDNIAQRQLSMMSLDGDNFLTIKAAEGSYN